MNKLKTELAKSIYTGKTDQECLDLLYTNSVRIQTDVSAHDIRKQLVLVNKLLQIEGSTADSAKAAVRMLEIFPVFSLNEAEVKSMFEGMLDALIVDTLLSETDKTNLLNLGQKDITPVEALGLGKVRIGHIIGVRN